MCEFLIPTKIRISKIPHAGTGRFLYIIIKKVLLSENKLLVVLVYTLLKIILV